MADKVLKFSVHCENWENSKIIYSPQNNSPINLAIKNMLQDFDNFDETNELNISKIEISINNNPFNKSKITTFRQNTELIINNLKDLVHILYLIKTYELLVDTIRTNSVVKENSNEEILINNFAEYVRTLDVKKNIEYNFSKFLGFEALKHSLFIPAAIYDSMHHNFDLGHRPKLSIFMRLTYLGVMIPLSPVFAVGGGSYGLYKGSQSKTEKISQLQEINADIEKNPIYREYTGIFGLESDLIIYEKLYSSNVAEYIDKEEETPKDKIREVFIVREEIVDRNTGQTNFIINEKNELEYNVLPQDMRHEIMTFIVGKEEGDIMKQIIDNKKDRPKAIEELKQKRTEKTLLKKDKAMSKHSNEKS